MPPLHLIEVLVINTLLNTRNNVQGNRDTFPFTREGTVEVWFKYLLLKLTWSTKISNTDPVTLTNILKFWRCGNHYLWLHDGGKGLWKIISKYNEMLVIHEILFLTNVTPLSIGKPRHYNLYRHAPVRFLAWSCHIPVSHRKIWLNG